MKHKIISILSSILLVQSVSAQQILTLEQCRQMAISNNKTLEEERVKTEMAGIDRKIAAANYYPNISVTGAYLHNGDNISLVTGEQSAFLGNIGTTAQQALSSKLTGMVQGIMSDPQALASPAWQSVLKTLSTADISTTLNGIGSEIDKALHFDISNVGAGIASLQQPVFAGGKIVASNQIARMAQELAQSRYDGKYSDVIVEVDSNYWQIVSIAAKKKLAENYNDLLAQMLKDAEAAISEGIITEADGLSVKVRANEAAMLLTRSINGLKLSKMLLCKQIGLPLDSEIILEEENASTIEIPQLLPQKTMEDIFASRPEMKQLELASKIYDKKVAVARADMMPSVAVVANYLYSNPNILNGFQKNWAGTWNAGVLLRVPIFHGTEALQKTRKAKAEAQLYKIKYDDAKALINLQVNQLRCQYEEAKERLAMAESNIDSAEENLRCAMVGFEAGVVPSSTTLAAQTAWLQANSEYIDAMIGVQMAVVNINKAEGNKIE